MTDTIDRVEIEFVVLHADPGTFQDYRRRGGADPGQLLMHLGEGGCCAGVDVAGALMADFDLDRFVAGPIIVSIVGKLAPSNPAPSSWPSGYVDMLRPGISA